MKFEDICLDNLKGFLNIREGEHLYKTAKDASKLGPCLEVGSYCGKSSVCIGFGCKNNNEILFSIDHHQGSAEQQPGEEYFDPALFNSITGRVDTFGTFRQTIQTAGLEDTIVPIVCRSEIVAKSWKTRLGFVFIDGGHSYPDVYTDYTTWSRHIVPGGYLVFHDIFINPEEGGQGPHHVYQQALSSGYFSKRPMVGTLGVLQKNNFTI